MKQCERGAVPVHRKNLTVHRSVFIGQSRIQHIHIQPGSVRDHGFRPQIGRRRTKAVGTVMTAQGVTAQANTHLLPSGIPDLYIHSGKIHITGIADLTAGL